MGMLLCNLDSSLLELVRRTSTELPADVRNVIHQAIQREQQDSIAQNALNIIERNIQLAQERSLPLCQDTGSCLFYIDCPVGLDQMMFAEKAREAGFDCAITMDADGQHLASDIPAFVQAARQHPGSLVVGCRNLSAKNMPSANTFANKFSNFWFRLQTGIDLPDTQTGFRLYPLKRIGKKMWWMTSRYEAELELLIYAAWRGIRLIPVKTHVYYPPAQERVTHFRPVYDFARISLLNVVVCILAVIIGLPLRLIRLSCPDRS